LKSGFYRKVLLYKLGGLKASKEDVGKQEARLVMREAVQYVLIRLKPGCSTENATGIGRKRGGGRCRNDPR